MSNAAHVSGGFVRSLSEKTLPELSRGIVRPNYDRSKVQHGIVHIGVGGFHRAHQAVYLDDFLGQIGGMEWGLCGVGLLPQDQGMNAALGAQDCLFTVVERSAAGDEARIIGSMTNFLWSGDSGEAVLAKLAHPTTRIVSLTITEGGYCINQATGKFDPQARGIQEDLKNPTKPQGVFGYLVEALDRRRKAGIPPFTILSCDNLQGNGHVAKHTVTSFAALRDAGLAEWISKSVAFPNSMVDRITPVTTDEDRAMVKDRFGIDDKWPVVTEPFRQWIVEDTFCHGRPALEKVGVQFTSDVQPYELMKIRLLNASHSAMGYLGYLAGYRYIYEIMADAQFREYILRFMDQEVTPLLKPVPGINLDGYKKTLVVRFANPTIKDQAARICMDGSNKMPKFLLPSVVEQIQRGGPTKYLTLAVASWFRYLRGVDEQGQAIRIDDPRAEMLKRRALEGQNDPLPLLRERELFGDLADAASFVSDLRVALESLTAKGAKATLAAYLA